MSPVPFLLSFADAWRTRSAFDRATADLRPVQAGTVVALVGDHQPVDPQTVARRALAAGGRRLILVVDRGDWTPETALQAGADAALQLSPGVTGADDARAVRDLLLATGAFRRCDPTRRPRLPMLRALIGRPAGTGRGVGGRV